MDHIFNIQEIKRRMKDKPKAQRLQDFFNRDEIEALTQEQIKEVISIILECTNETLKKI